MVNRTGWMDSPGQLSPVVLALLAITLAVGGVVAGTIVFSFAATMRGAFALIGVGILLGLVKFARML